MADNSPTLCTATVNGTTITCACGGCGIAYNHETKTYHILCCGSITTMKALNQSDDPINPPKRGHIMVDLSNVTLLEAAQLLERALPGKIAINSSLKKLRKQVTLKANLPLAKLTKKLGLKSSK